jgi:uncharacterized DUF497 family protein
LIYTDLYEWDDKKAEINRAKHGVSFAEAAAVFDDPRALFRDDPVHSGAERRFHVMGRAAGRLLAVCYTIRGERSRLISARMASREERRLYAKTQK